MRTPIENRRNSVLYLYEGIHDGYTGSVPLSQTLRLYNKVVSDFSPDAKQALVPLEDMVTMLAQRGFPGASESEFFLDRKVIYRKELGNIVYLMIFEGGHEMPQGDVLSHVQKYTSIRSAPDLQDSHRITPSRRLDRQSAVSGKGGSVRVDLEG